ncbi:MAG: glycosyltransferase family 2 protein [Syntrophaceae bacterium]
MIELAAQIIFWGGTAFIFYSYAGYPIILYLLPKSDCRETVAPPGPPGLPPVSIIIPVHNEERVIREKIENTLALDYPENRREIIIVSDGSTDQTSPIAREFNGRIQFYDLLERNGKAAALNVGLRMAAPTPGGIIVFSDASIMLARNALMKIVRKFADVRIGCISGEDKIEGGGNEGLYGRYEMFIRNLESRSGSIVGASGCFYAQRRELCKPFPPGMAPDFFSVLATVSRGFRAVTEPSAVGFMKEPGEARASFERKVRTLLRGITTLMHFKKVLNPLRFGLFSFRVISHKLMRWSAGIVLVLIFASSLVLSGLPLYRAALFLQIVFYTCAALGLLGISGAAFRIPLFFIMINVSALIAWFKYFTGVRQELWEPSKR